MVHDGLTNPFSGKQMFDEATEVGDELEITRPDLDRWALRSHERAIEATDEGRLPEEIVPVTVKGRKGDTVVEIDEGPRRDTLARGAGQAAGPGLQGGLAHGRQLAGRQRRRAARWCSPPTSGPRPTARRRWPRSSPTRRAPTTSPTWPPRRPPRRKKALEKAGLKAERHRPVGDQRGVRLGHPELDPHARHRRGQGQRQRRRRRARPPDRRVRRAHPRRRSCTSCAGAAAASAARRSARGGGQGDAVIVARQRLEGAAHSSDGRREAARSSAKACTPQPSSISIAR